MVVLLGHTHPQRAGASPVTGGLKFPALTALPRCRFRRRWSERASPAKVVTAHVVEVPADVPVRGPLIVVGGRVSAQSSRRLENKPGFVLLKSQVVLQHKKVRCNACSQSLLRFLPTRRVNTTHTEIEILLAL